MSPTDQKAAEPKRSTSPISAQRSAPDVQQDTGELLDSLLEHIPDRIYFKDKQSRFIRVSRAKAERHGMAPSEMIGKTDFDLFTSEHSQAAFEDEQQILQTGEAIASKVEKETMPGGQVRWALTTKLPLWNKRGELIGTCGISKDVTDLKEMEDALAKSNAELGEALAELKQTHEVLKAAQGRLIEAEKAQTAARLAAGVAHEVRNPLNILSTGIEFLSTDPAVAADETTSAVVAEMREAIYRADAVVCGLMDCSEATHLHMEQADVNALLDSALARRQREITANQIAVTRRFAQDLPPIKMDAKKIGTVLDGVLSNAVEAMGKPGGALIVSTKMEARTPDEAAGRHDPGDRSGKRARGSGNETLVVIEVEDSGPGIPPESLHDVFDPFFTTKETGSGTGLGLTVCRKVLELHGGSIEICNRDEGGAKVRIALNVS